LLDGLTALIARDRTTTAELLAHIAEVDVRQLYLPVGYPSMHAYCVQELRLSEDVANKRIRVARKAREVPTLFAAIADGRIHLSGVILLASYMTSDNAEELIGAAEGKSKNEIEALIAARHPCSETLPMVETFAATKSTVETVEPEPSPVAPAARILPAPGPVASIPKRSKVEPIARERYVLRVCLGQATHHKLRHAEALLSHKIPSGDLAAILGRVLDLAIEQLEKRKFGASSKRRPAENPSKNPRHVPAHVRHAVWHRDGGQCTFVSETGLRCAERKRLEFDHAIPVAHGGPATIENIRLCCRAHNQYAAAQVFGTEFMRHRRSAAHG